jgi:cytoskeleton protein RodZ
VSEADQQGPADGGATPGQRLALARESRGMTVDKAAEDLHLDMWVVEAMEAGEYAKIGPSVYVKGYLKRYASIVGLPADDIVQAYERSQMMRPAMAEPVPAARPTPPPATAQLPWRELGAIAALLALVALVMWWKPWTLHRSSHVPAPSTTAHPAPPAPASGGAASAAPSAPAPAAASPAGGATPAPEPVAPAGTPSRLRLSFSADSWVEVRDANRRVVYSGLGKANSIKTLHARAPLAVYLGSVNGVQLEINDRAVPIEDRFVNGDSARFALEADGIPHRIAR